MVPTSNSAKRLAARSELYNDGVGVVSRQETAARGRVSFRLKRNNITYQCYKPHVYAAYKTLDQLTIAFGRTVSDRLLPFGRMRVPIVGSIWATRRTSTKRLVILVLTDLDKGRHWVGCRGCRAGAVLGGWDGMESMVNDQWGKEH